MGLILNAAPWVVNQQGRSSVSFRKDFLMSRFLVESPYDGPVRTVTVAVAGRSIELVRPGDPDRLLEDPEVAGFNERDDYMPYWAYLWPGAFLLAEVLSANPWPVGTRALELGCGLGLTGLVGVALGLNVRFTDHDRTPLRFVERSAAANGFDTTRASTALLDWREPPAERYPLILGADITYERRLIPLVAGVLAAMLEPGGVALISDPGRSPAEEFVPILSRAGLDCTEQTVRAESAELGSLRGTIYRITPRPESA